MNGAEMGLGSLLTGSGAFGRAPNGTNARDCGSSSVSVGLEGLLSAASGSLGDEGRVDEVDFREALSATGSIFAMICTGGGGEIARRELIVNDGLYVPRLQSHTASELACQLRLSAPTKAVSSP